MPLAKKEYHCRKRGCGFVGRTPGAVFQHQMESHRRLAKMEKARFVAPRGALVRKEPEQQLSAIFPGELTVELGEYRLTIERLKN